MSTNPAAPTPADVATPAQAAPTTEPAASEVDSTDWKAEARKWEDRAKANKNAAEMLAAIEEANQTEAQKVAKRLADAEKKAVEAEAKVLRRDVAIDHKLSKEDAALLDTITDEAAMRALAARLSPPENDRTQGNVAPTEGGNPNPGDSKSDEREFVGQLFGRVD